MAPLLSACVEGRMTGCTGDAAVAETMVMPNRHKNMAKIAQFAGTKNMRLMAALHYATAIQSGCRFLITIDEGMKSSDEIEVIYVKGLQA